jgi:hypothetical protein
VGSGGAGRLGGVGTGGVGPPARSSLAHASPHNATDVAAIPAMAFALQPP